MGKERDDPSRKRGGWKGVFCRMILMGRQEIDNKKMNLVVSAVQRQESKMSHLRETRGKKTKKLHYPDKSITLSNLNEVRLPPVSTEWLGMMVPTGYKPEKRENRLSVWQAERILPTDKTATIERTL